MLFIREFAVECSAYNVSAYKGSAYEALHEALVDYNVRSRDTYQGSALVLFLKDLLVSTLHGIDVIYCPRTSQKVLSLYI